jgi:hypothetical protein
LEEISTSVLHSCHPRIGRCRNRTFCARWRLIFFSIFTSVGLSGSALGLETRASHYHFVRRYLEHNPQLPLSLRQVDPLIRQLTLYRDLIESRTQNSKQENPS